MTREDAAKRRAEEMEALTGVKLTGNMLEDAKRMEAAGFKAASYDFILTENKNEHLDEMIRGLEETGKGFSVQFMTLSDGRKMAMLKVEGE